jgi:hypothetical protein
VCVKTAPKRDRRYYKEMDRVSVSREVVKGVGGDVPVPFRFMLTSMLIVVHFQVKLNKLFN